MLNASDILRGYIDTIILAQLREKDNYGYQISKSVADISGGVLELKEGTLYTTFRRLENTGLIESYWGDEQAGARRRYYRLTEKGRETLKDNLEDWKRYASLLERILSREV